MKKITICLILIFLCSLIFYNSCNRVSKTSKKSLHGNYETATVLYPRINGPWEVIDFYNVPPESFTQDTIFMYHINKLKIKDTTFINRLTKSIISRNTIVASKNYTFDTWFMVLLANQKDSLIDTLAVCHNIMWFNREIYIDSTTVNFITDEIIRQDKEFAMTVNEYYDKGRWYPFLGKELTDRLLMDSND